jgi:hypothetical protein
MAVAGETRDAEEQRPGRDLAVVIGESDDLYTGIRGRDTADHLVQPHGRRV